MQGVIGYLVIMIGSVLSMFNVIDVTRGAGLPALVPGGLFELVLPIWLFARGFRAQSIDSPIGGARRASTPTQLVSTSSARRP